MIYINNKEKLNRIRKEKEIFVITDFDRTLTTKKSEPTMGVIPEYLGGEFLEERLKIFNHYRPIELDYTLEDDVKQKYMKDWAKASFTLLSKYITEEIVIKSIVDSKLYLRNGVKEMFDELKEKDVPIVIMSSGVGNVVEQFLKTKNCLAKNVNIVSNFFEFKENKAYIDFENIMATSNKKYERVPENLKCEIENKKAGFLFGDLVEDLKMIDDKTLSKTLTFGFLDENIEDNLGKFNSNFDVVLTGNEDFITVMNVLEGKI